MFAVELDNGEMIYLKSFPSSKVGEFLRFAKEQRLVDENTCQIHATGGGAYKYSDIFEQELGPLGIQIKKHDEMESLVNGMSFILNYAKQPAFTFSEAEGRNFLEKKDTTQFPKLLVSIGSGVSIIKVNTFSDF